jgi:hypothetical protein
LPIFHWALTGSPPRNQTWSLGISPLTNNAASSAESGLDQESTFRNVRFWRKADIFTDIHRSDFAELPWHGEKGLPRISPCGAEADMPLKWISDAAGKKRRAAEFSP